MPHDCSLGPGVRGRARRTGRRIGIRVTATVAAVMLLTTTLTGCAVVAEQFADGDFGTAIPTALQASDAGVADAFAEKGLDGFTLYLSVGVSLDDAELSEAELAEILRVIVAGNDLPTDRIRLSVQDADGAFIAIDEMVQAIAPDLVPGTADDMLSVTTEQARTLIELIENG